MNTATQNSTLSTNLATEEIHRGMIPPRIPEAIYDEDHQGLLPLTQLGKPVRVEFGGWPAIRPNHSYQLLLDGVLIGEIKLTTTEKPGDLLFLDIPTEYLVEGEYAVAYRATIINNGVHEDSTTIPLRIVTTAPGLPKLAPMKFPQEVDCGLTSAELIGLGGQLVAEVGSYAGIYQHDVIRTYWGNVEGPGAVVTKTTTGVNRVPVTFTRTFLQSLGDFDGFVTYTVEDRAGNISEPSLGTPIRLLLSDALDCVQDSAVEKDSSPTPHINNVVDITLRVQSILSNPTTPR